MGISISWQGLYEPNTPYVLNNAVYYNGSAYICIVQSVIGQLPTNTSYWSLMVEAGANGTNGISIDWKGTWSNNTIYNAYDAVYYNGSAYICIVSSGQLGTLPTNTIYWNLLALQGIAGTNGSGLNWKGNWNSTTNYSIYDAVSYNGSSYICILANTGQALTNTAYWNLLAEAGNTGNTGATGSTGPQGLVWIGNWSNTITYIINNNAVYYKGSSYICIKGNQNIIPGSDNGIYWNILATGGSNGMIWCGIWTSTTQYIPTDVVYYNGSSYISNTTNTNIQPGTTNDWSLVAEQGATGPAGPAGSSGSGSGGSGSGLSLDQIIPYIIALGD